MAQFTVRIELHKAVGDDYTRLHKAMEAGGFRRYVAGVEQGSNKQGIYHLPEAEYDYTSAGSANDVRLYAKGIADRIRAGAWCLVTQVADRSWNTQLIRYL